MKSSDDQVLNGRITKMLPGGWFQVKVTLGEEDDALSYEVMAKLSGPMKRNRIRVIEGDYVDVRIGSADLEKGVIEFRHNYKKTN